MKTFYSLLLFLFISGSSFAAGLNPGDILFVGFNADTDDGIAFVAMNPIPAGTTIYFTDNEWNGMAIGAGGAFNSLTEGVISWTATADVPAATVITITNTNSVTIAASCGSTALEINNLNLNTSNEVVYAYMGSTNSTPTCFLTALANDSFTASNGTLDGTGLTDGVNAIDIDGDEDVGVFVSDGDANVFDSAADILNVTNWETQDGSGNQHTDGTFPDFPGNVANDTGGAGCAAALPVSLEDFRLTARQDAIVLEWITLEEINNDRFEIEWRTDDKTFTTIHTENGYGNSSEAKYYQYRHRDAVEGVNYYRLKQFDFDGSFKYSNILYSRIESDSNVSVYPNLVSDVITVTGENISSIKVLNLNGQLISSHQNMTFDLSSLNSGTYIIQIDTPSKTSFERIIKM